MFLSGRWSPSRPVLNSIFTFTFIVLVVSVFHTSQFDFSYPGVWAWFGLYIALPVSGGYHLWLYRSMPTRHRHPVPILWRYILQGTGLVLALYGLALAYVRPNLIAQDIKFRC